MYCPQVQVVAECTESEVAYRSIKKLQPDMVFMDIEMPVMNGFQLVERSVKLISTSYLQRLMIRLQ